MTNFHLPFRTQKKSEELFWSFFCQSKVFLWLRMRHICEFSRKPRNKVSELRARAHGGDCPLSPTTPHGVAQEGKRPGALRKKQWCLFHQSMMVHPFFRSSMCSLMTHILQANAHEVEIDLTSGAQFFTLWLLFSWKTWASLLLADTSWFDVFSTPLRFPEMGAWY